MHFADLSVLTQSCNIECRQSSKSVDSRHTVKFIKLGSVRYVRPGRERTMRMCWRIMRIQDVSVWLLILTRFEYPPIWIKYEFISEISVILLFPSRRSLTDISQITIKIWIYISKIFQDTSMDNHHPSMHSFSQIISYFAQEFPQQIPQYYSNVFEYIFSNTSCVFPNFEKSCRPRQSVLSSPQRDSDWNEIQSIKKILLNILNGNWR